MLKFKIYPPLLTLLLGLVSLSLHTLLPQPQLILLPVIGLGFMFVGVAMNLWAARWFKLKQTPIDPHGHAHYLAQEGLYRISRNPMYLGMLVSLTGLSVYLGSLAAFLTPPLFIWIITLRFIRREEQALQALFGAKYLRYQSRVRRWI